MWILWQPHLGFEKITLAAEQSIIQGPKGRMYMWRQAEDLHILGERVKTLHSTEDPTLWSGSLLSRQPSLWEACLTAGREALCSELTPYMEKADRLKIQTSNHQSFLCSELTPYMEKVDRLTIQPSNHQSFLCSELTPYMEKADRLKIQPSNHQSFLCSELTPYMEKADRLKIQPSNHQSFLSPCEWGPPTWNDENALVWGIWQNDLHISLKAFKYTQISPVLKQKQLSLFHLISALHSVRLVLPNTKCRQRHHKKTKKKKRRKLQTNHCYEHKLKIK